MFQTFVLFTIRLGFWFLVSGFWSPSVSGFWFLVSGLPRGLGFWFLDCGPPLAPEWLWPFISLPKLIRAEAIALKLVGGDWVGSHVYPQFKVLPMGWAWSVYFCQSSHGCLVMRSGAVETTDNLVDLGPAPELSKQKCVWLAYIDNSFVASLDPTVAAQARSTIDNTFRSSGLLVHEVTEPFTFASFLGLEVDGDPGVLHPSQVSVEVVPSHIASSGASVHYVSKPFSDSWPSHLFVVHRQKTFVDSVCRVSVCEQRIQNPEAALAPSNS